MLAGQDIANEYQNGYSLVPATRTSSADGTGVDCRDCGPEVVSVLSVGAVSGTTPTLDVKLQESSDNSTFTDISGATHTQVTAANKIEVIVTAKRTKRYVRASATIAGTNPSFACAATLHAPKISW